MKLDTDSVYLASAEKELLDCIWKEKSQDWESLLSKDCEYSVTAQACC